MNSARRGTQNSGVGTQNTHLQCSEPVNPPKKGQFSRERCTHVWVELPPQVPNICWDAGYVGWDMMSAWYRAGRATSLYWTKIIGITIMIGPKHELIFGSGLNP